ncbi:SGNH/GDSL hydrolase family protein [Nocardia macrotermitis]|uniref:SGNH hydrolase-type esterase domain-containing protein n=1 Tax=Nocardia macrotermitis TaxID=2585198 RepID=A0A7K0DA76_9NOCA|nr:SGNH/GDSL hydrolase family protein [Nocardia macrotermitis]MQY22607.1 hypothetical protein [Nocardia macrotermitis]
MTDSVNGAGTATEAADPLCLAPKAAAELLRDSPWRRFAVIGDSFAKGVGGPSAGYADTPWPERVADALRSGTPDLEYLNTGVLGVKSEQVRREQLPRVLEFGPDLVNIACGGNDLWVAEPDYDAIEAELDTLYAALREQGADIFAFTVANVFDRQPELAPFRDRIAAFNERIRTVAARHHALLVEMWEHPVRLRPTVMSDDGVHFSMEGQAALAAEVVKALAAGARDALETK